ncbi:MAG: cupin domain-containing protein [bacterium]|nr:cupin domain-containing protein [bacterium]
MRKVLRNPISGETFTMIQSGADTDGDYLQFEWLLKKGSAMPFAHVHPLQSETFEVLSGELTMMMNGKAEVVRAGGMIAVPRETPHQPRNTGEGDLRCRVTKRPARQTEALLEAICDLAAKGEADPKGRPNFFQLARLAARYPDEGYLATVPIWVQKWGIRAAAWLGRFFALL